MYNHDLSDTITAIATPLGESGIGVIRISGKDALGVAERIFVGSNGKKPSDFPTHTVHHGWIVKSHQVTLPVRQAGRSPGPQKEKNNPSTLDLRSSRDIIDEVLLTVMCAPKSYTGEDCVEISCHGSMVGLRSVLELVLENGCRLASPGEFTKRAFLNGRLDLSQAEAVLDIIQAKTDSALRLGVQQLKGVLSTKINETREILLDMLSILEANIDFPEEEISVADLKEIAQGLEKINRQFADILATAKQGKILRAGINTVICGKPNVGKSSLLNALLRQERSIVTPIAGTTRDFIEEIIDIQGIPVKIVDTAGIIEPQDLIEKQAVLRSQKQIATADLVILVFDGSKRLSAEDEILIKRLKNKHIIPVVNKIDLKQKIGKSKLIKIFGRVVEISAKKSRNINLLEETIVDLIYDDKIKSSESALVSNLRHIQLLKLAQKSVAQVSNSLDNKLSFEFMAQDLKDALGYLDELLGKKFSQDLLDKIFSEFCIGK